MSDENMNQGDSGVGAGDQPVEKTVKQFQAEVVELGMPAEDAVTLTTKAGLKAVINTLKASATQKVVEPVKTIKEKPNPSEDRLVNKQFLTKAETMRCKLESQPNVRFFLPLVGAEKPGVIREVMVHGRTEQVIVSGAVEVVQLNGYKTFIPKGRFVEIPQQVADILSESMMATQQAGADLLIDRVDPKTGRQVGEQL